MGFESRNTSAPAIGRFRRGDAGCPGHCPPEYSRSEPSDDDPDIVRALEAYLAACELGAKPEREPFLAQHPAIAPRLADCLESIDYLR